MLLGVSGDLFDAAESGVAFAHCVSRDFYMGKGIAVGFKQRYGRVAELLASNTQIGQVASLWNKETSQWIYYLVTKEHYWDKPTMESLAACLTGLRAHMAANGVQRLAIPRLGCGLDRLSWSAVRGMIERTFKEDELEITVYCWDGVSLR